MPYITYKPNGRFGNNMLQYMTCKLLSLLSDNAYTYINYFEFPKEFTVFKEDDYTKVIVEGFTGLPDTHILCDGYFQKSALLAKHRDYFLECMKSDDIFVERKSDFSDISLENSSLYPISSVFKVESSRKFLPTDAVISIRLGDFIQYPCKTSDIVPPSFYFNMLKRAKFTQLYIVCDNPEKDWEKSYLALFDTYKAIRINASHMEDFATLRAAPTLIHSNSTFCWLASFFGNPTRYIPQTDMYKNQDPSLIMTLSTFLSGPSPSACTNSPTESQMNLSWPRFPRRPRCGQMSFQGSQRPIVMVLGRRTPITRCISVHDSPLHGKRVDGIACDIMKSWQMVVFPCSAI